MNKKTIKIQNISFETKKEEVEKEFSKLGKIKKISMPLNKGKPQGICYIEFEEEESKINSIKLHKNQMFGRRISIEESEFPEDTEINTLKIIIKNLDFSMKNEDIEKIVSKYGKIEKIYTPYRPDNKNKNKGFCFVTFENKESLIKSLELNKILTEGRQLTVEPSYQKPEESKRAWKEKAKTEEHVFDDKKTIMVSGLSFSLNQERLKSIFEEYGPISHIKLPYEKDEEGNQQLKGYGFIEFKDEESVEESIEGQDKTEIKGRMIRVERFINDKKKIQENKEKNVEREINKLKRKRQYLEEEEEE
jgi:RNA recognition motif-containing protein